MHADIGFSRGRPHPIPAHAIMPFPVHTFSRRCDAFAILHLGLGTDDPHTLCMYACLVLCSRSGNYAGRHRFINAQLCAHCNWFPHDLELGYQIKYVNRLRQHFAGLRLGGKYYLAIVITGLSNFNIVSPTGYNQIPVYAIVYCPSNPFMALSKSLAHSLAH